MNGYMQHTMHTLHFLIFVYNSDLETQGADSAYKPHRAVPGIKCYRASQNAPLKRAKAHETTPRLVEHTAPGNSHRAAQDV